MGDVAFKISPAARRMIAGLTLGDKVPGYCLEYTIGYRVADENREVFAAYSGGNFKIFGREENDAPVFELNGVPFASSPESLAQLNGKTLVVVKVPVGVPDPASDYHKVLVAK